MSTALKMLQVQLGLMGRGDFDLSRLDPQPTIEYLEENVWVQVRACVGGDCQHRISSPSVGPVLGPETAAWKSLIFYSCAVVRDPHRCAVEVVEALASRVEMRPERVAARCFSVPGRASLARIDALTRVPEDTWRSWLGILAVLPSVWALHLPISMAKGMRFKKTWARNVWRVSTHHDLVVRERGLRPQPFTTTSVCDAAMEEYGIRRSATEENEVV